MKIHKTKGIVIKTVKYGETSVITTIYTELFGLQTYIVKGVRQSSKKKNTAIVFFQPSAILELQVYHNELKNLQFIKEYHWSNVYTNVFTDVVKYAVAMYIVELFSYIVKQPETNTFLYDFLEQILVFTDNGTEQEVANIPILFAFGLSKQLGFQIQGTYTAESNYLNIREGVFTEIAPVDEDIYTENILQAISAINSMESSIQKIDLQLNKTTRRTILGIAHQFLKYHIADFGEIKSMLVLQTVLK